MPVHRYLDLSTAHLPEEESERILAAPVRVIAHEYGWWVNVPGLGDYDDYDVAGEGFEGLDTVLRYARYHDCTWVNFDRDGDVDPNLLTYEWSA